MYRDNTLIPTEAIRLAALGSLTEGDRQYATLASEIRNFVGLISGPSLDLLGTSLEVLGYEGLAEIKDNKDPNLTILRITEAGKKQFVALMTSGFRVPINDVGKLVIALKMRFLYLLDDEERIEQIELLREICEGEVSRLRSLLKQSPNPDFSEWLKFEIRQLGVRIDWLKGISKIL